jgi:hypothetical protein
MVRYTFEQRVFLYDTYVKCASAAKCRPKFRDERVPSRQTIHNLVNKFKTTGLLIDKEQKHKRRVLIEEKLDDIATRLEHTPSKSLKCLALEIGVSKSSARTVTQLLKPSSESWCLVCCKCKKGCCTSVLLTKQLIAKDIYVQRDSIFNTSCNLWTNVTASLHSKCHRHAESWAIFACDPQQAALRSPWNTGLWMRHVY